MLVFYSEFFNFTPACQSDFITDRLLATLNYKQLVLDFLHWADILKTLGVFYMRCFILAENSTVRYFHMLVLIVVLMINLTIY